MSHDLITARHLARQAVIYIRQSSPHQVLTNQESLRLQYALKTRALELGWHENDMGAALLRDRVIHGINGREETA